MVRIMSSPIIVPAPRCVSPAVNITFSHDVDQGNELPTAFFVQAMCNCSRCGFVMIRIMLRIMLSPAIVPASWVD